MRSIKYIVRSIKFYLVYYLLLCAYSKTSKDDCYLMAALMVQPERHFYCNKYFYGRNKQLHVSYDYIKLIDNFLDIQNKQHTK